MAHADIATVILAGGRATRFPGKLEAAFDGEPLLLRVYANVRDAAPIVIAGRGSFTEALDERLECPLVIDRWPDRGPLGGIVSAASAVHAPRIFVVAGDAPHVTTAVLDALAQAWQPGDEAAVPMHGTQIEPLAALYDRLAILREGAALLAERESASMHALLERLRVRRVVLDAANFTNVNTANDLVNSQGTP
ncbi:MAG: molybdenum cofactor guanylyltransferase [bacterium]|nr:molybdenum cofactor guanylyltransferase [bacterium]